MIYETDTKRYVTFDGTSWFPVAGAMPRCSVTSNVAVSIPNTTTTSVAFNIESYDTDVIHDNVTNNSRLTIPAGLGGLWYFDYFVDWQANATGFRYSWISFDGVTASRYAPQGGAGASGTNGVYQSGALTIALSAGQYAQLICLQDSGVALNTIQVSGARFTARYLGPA